MKKNSDKIMAQRLLINRSHGFAPGPFLRLRGKSYAAYTMVPAVILVLLALGGYWFAFGLIVSFLAGVFFVYARWLRGMQRTWPFLSSMMKWDEVERISQGD